MDSLAVDLNPQQPAAASPPVAPLPSWRLPALVAAGASAALGWVAYNRLRNAAALTKLRGQTALITGGTRGLGLSLARELASLECRVVICARDEGELRRARAELESRTSEVMAVPCDVSSREQVERAVEQVRQRFGPIDILINNAGIIVVGPAENMTQEDFRLCMDTMFWGTLYPSLAVLPDMLTRRSGKILNVTSIGGRVAVPHLLPYCCAKAACVALSEGLRAELSPRGIQVVTAVPGLMRTGSHVNALFRGQADREYSWFKLAATLPGVAKEASNAAREMLVALGQNRAEPRITLAAEVLADLHGLMPGLVTDLLGLVTPLALPGPAALNNRPVQGSALHSELPAWMDKLTVLGQVAQERYQLHKS